MNAREKFLEITHFKRKVHSCQVMGQPVGKRRTKDGIKKDYLKTFVLAMNIVNLKNLDVEKTFIKTSISSGRYAILPTIVNWTVWNSLILD